MPTTLEGADMAKAARIVRQGAIKQAIVDALGRPLTAGEAATVGTWLAWIEAWRERGPSGS